MNRNRYPHASGRQVLRIALALVAAVVAVGGAMWILARPGRVVSVPTTTQLPEYTLAATQAVATQVLATTPTDVIAWVNGKALSSAALSERQALDRALNAFFQIPADAENTSLDRVINEMVVLDVARRAGFEVSSDAVSQELERLLGANEKTEADLDAALRAEELSLTTFRDYLAALIVVREFTSVQAAARALSPEAYVLDLREVSDVQIPEGVVAAGEPVPVLKMTVAPHATPTLSSATETAVAPAPTQTPVASAAGAAFNGGVGQQAPDFALALAGDPTAPPLALSGLRGAPVVLSFWVTWCSHCRAQTPALLDAHARYAPTGVQFVGINVKEDREVIQQYVEAQGIPYPILMDTGGGITQQYHVPGFPTTYFLDENGLVLARHVGALSENAINEYIVLMGR